MVRRTAVVAVLALTLAGLVTSPAPGVTLPGQAPAPAPAVRPVPGAALRAFDAPAHAYGPGHRGVALAATPGDVVRTVLAGTVTFSGEVARRGWVTVYHGGGLETTYGWLEERAVARHARVRAGDVLGVLSAGRARLHWGARLHGSYVDPLLLLGRWEVRLVPLP